MNPTATVRYRQHSGNQTGVLAGVKTKNDYYMLRIDPLCRRADSLEQRLGGYAELTEYLRLFQDWSYARERYYRKANIASARRMWAGRRFEIRHTIFELVLPIIPDSLFEYIINLLK